MRRVATTVLLLFAGLTLAGTYPPSRSYAQGFTSPIASSAVQAAPLSNLQPATGLLPSGTQLVVLNVTTAAPAECRWSETANTAYANMPNAFQFGQGNLGHSTLIEGFADLQERRFYVRCRDLSTGRNPDGFELQTHLRVLGPWTNRYPRVANLWNNFATNPGVEFVAGFDLHVVFGGPNQASQARAIRAINPNAKVLLTTHATYGVPGVDSPATEWWTSQPGDMDYNCLSRNTQGAILLVAYWSHPMYNMTVPYCRAMLAQMSIDAFLSTDPNWGAGLAYDGLYWDRLHDTIDWLGPNIDSNLDGQRDVPSDLNGAYRAGVIDFIARVQTRLPYALLMGNDAGVVYTRWINGRNYEVQLAALLEGTEAFTWNEVMQDYRYWAGVSQMPRTTFIANTPESLYLGKFTFLNLNQMPPAMRAEAAASYSRMRYGLATALMGDGLFTYDYGPDGHGDRWWYDEYGAPGGSASTLPPAGYLGQPLNDPAMLASRPQTVDQVRNGSFESGLDDWVGWVDANTAAGATFDVDAAGGVSGTPATHVAINNTSGPDTVELRQLGKATHKHSFYTVSFWGRSTLTHTIDIRLIRHTYPWLNTGFAVQATLTPEWQSFQLTDEALMTTDDLRLVFQLGRETDEVWLDDVRFEDAAVGVWARPFEHGLAVINTSLIAQTVVLPKFYRKLNGSQAPLFQARVDDDEASAGGNWTELPASFSQFGSTVHAAFGPNPLATIYYRPDLLYEDDYQVLAWVAPDAAQSSAVNVTIQHADGATTVTLNETQGAIGWRDLGTYRFNVGSAGYAALTATGNGVVVADAFKWVSTARYNDGRLVYQVDLQPQDAIILQEAPATAFEAVYLPLVARVAP